MRRRFPTLVATALVSVVTPACTGAAAPATLAEQLTVHAGTVTTAITALQDALGRRYDTLPQLYAVITDMRLTVTIAVALDKAARTPADEASRVELDRYLEFGDEVLTSLADLDAAIATQDVGAASRAAAALDASAGAAALDLGTDLCAIAVPPSSQDLCDRVPPVGEYESVLQRVFLEFIADYRPLLRLPDAFGDVVRGAVLTRMAPDVVALLDSVTAQLGALHPDQPHVTLHEALVAFLTDTRARWVAVDPAQADLLIGELLVADLRGVTCAHATEIAAARALLLGAVPDSAMPAALAVLFDDPDAGCVDR